MRHIQSFGRVLLIIALAAIMAAASTPRKISYQGRATDAAGNPVPDGSYPAQFHIYDHPTAGTDRWSEIFPMVTTSGGLFTYVLGSATPIPDSLFARYDSLYLQVIFNGVILSPRTPITSVGYAMRVNTVDGASGGNIWANAYRGVGVYDTGASARTAFEGFVYSPTTDTVAAVSGNALNGSNGGAYGGTFFSQTAGSGLAYGVKGKGDAAGSAAAFGFYGYAQARGAGHAYGGYFSTDAGGSGDHTGVYAHANGGLSSTYTTGGHIVAQGNGGTTRGLSSSAYTFNGTVQGAFVYGQCDAGSEPLYGIKSWVNSGTLYSGVSYAGYLENYMPSSSSAGTAYGLYAYSHGLTSSASSIGVYGLAQPDGSGSCAGGHFIADSTGTSRSYGCRGFGYTTGNNNAYGVTGHAANRSTGLVYGGYFEAYDYGTGTKTGVFGKAPTSGYAAYLDGNVRVTGNHTVLGTKSAAVEVAPEQYRLVYSQESPECWFEDFGEGQLAGGRTHIELDPEFLQTVTIDQLHSMKVFIQLNDPDCNGTAVIRSITGFDVVELMNGTGNATFSYRVVAKRRGYEDVRLAPMSGPTPSEVAAELESDRQADREEEQSLRLDAQRQKEESERQNIQSPEMRR